MIIEQKTWGRVSGSPEADLSEIHPCVAMVQSPTSRQLIVWWTTPVDDSALVVGNYTLVGPGAPRVLSVSRLGPQSCQLTTTELDRDARYVLEATGVT